MTSRHVERERDFRFWAVVSHAADLPGQWVAHCLDIDVVSQGNSPEHAMEMLQEAVCMAVEDDLGEGLDPTVVRSKAPPECWRAVFGLLDNGTKIDALPSESSANFDYVVEMRLWAWLPAETSANVPGPRFELPMKRQGHLLASATC